MKGFGKLLAAALLIAAGFPQMASADTIDQPTSNQVQQVPIQVPDQLPSDTKSYAEWKSQFGKEATLIDPSNSFLGFVVGNDGRFTMGTTGGDPENPNDNNRNILYGHPSPWSSYTTLNVDGNTSIYTPTSEAPADDNNQLSNASSEITNNIKVTQKVSIIHNTNTDRDDTVVVHYSMTNNDSANHDVGIRIMMDTMLGNNDAAPFRIPGIGSVTTETELTGDQIPEYWQAFDSLTNPTVTSQGTFYRSANDKPDKVQFTNWGHVYNNPWDYQIQPGAYNGDSAVSVYWNPKSLAPGETRDFVTYYGLSSFTQDLRPPLALSVTGDTSVTATKDSYNPNPFTVTAYLDNIGNGDANNVIATLNLPQGLHLVSGTNASVELDNMSAGQDKMASWHVVIDPSSNVRDLDYSVTINADNTESKTVSRSIHIPAISRAHSKTVVFIPGIMGTQLTQIQNDGTNRVVWKPSIWSASSDIRRLALDENGDSINTIVPNEPLEDFYGNIVNQLRQQGYDVHTFGYDWRMDNKTTAQKLNDFINQLGVDRVSIVAHSMGGLVASGYIADGHADKIDKLITLGTPYLGAPKALYGFETGNLLEWYQNILVGGDLKAIAANDTSVYELLPEARYFNYNDTYYVTKYYDNGWFHRSSSENITSYDATKDLIFSRPWARQNLMQKSEDFRSIDFNSILGSVDSYVIMGDKQTTIGKVRERYVKQSNGSYKYDGTDDIDPITGDGTVPVISANIGWHVDPDRAYYYSADHSKLPDEKSVIDQVKLILAGSPNTLAKDVHRVPIQTRTLKLKVECPVDLHIFDPNNEHLGPKPDGTFDARMTNGSEYVVGDRKFALLEDRNDYKVKMYGTGKGEMTFTEQEYDEDNKVIKTVRFDGVPITETTVIEANTDMENGIKLQLDVDGDGTVDKTISPSAVLDGANSFDETVPTVNVNVDGHQTPSGWYNTDVTVTATANDDLSGVNRIEYQLNDSTTPSIYHGPLMIEEGKNHLDIVAFDNNRNHSEAVSNDINIDKTPPVTQLKTSDPSNTNGWFKGNVDVSFTASDSFSGVERTEYSLDEGKTWIPYTKAIPFNEEGVHEIQYRSVDVAENVEGAKTYKVKIDKTAPELTVGWDPLTKGFVIHNVDPLSGPEIADLLVTPNNSNQSQEQSFILKDKAYNTLKASVIATMDGKQSKLRITKLVYNGVPVSVADNMVKIEWGQGNMVNQKLYVAEKLDIEAKYDDKTDTTFIHGTGIKSSNQEGLFILLLKTNKGELYY